MIYHNIDQSILDEVLHDGDTGWLTVSGAIQESTQEFPDTTFIEVRIVTHRTLTRTIKPAQSNPRTFTGSLAPRHALCT